VLGDLTFSRNQPLKSEEGKKEKKGKKKLEF
jgi:hypothetical protein